MGKRVRSISIVTGMLCGLTFPAAGLAGPGTTAPSGGSSLGKTTATIVGDAVQFRPCSFEATFTVSDPDNTFSLFQKASGDFPTYHTISGATLSGDPALSGDRSTCDIDTWTSTVQAVDDGGTAGEASDSLTFECRKDQNDIPTALRFSGGLVPGVSRAQTGTVIGATSFGCCFNITMSSSTPGGETEFEFIQVSGDLPPGVSQSDDNITGCLAVASISGNTSQTGNDIAYTPPTWTSKWKARNRNNRCEVSGISTLTLSCGYDY